MCMYSPIFFIFPVMDLILDFLWENLNIRMRNEKNFISKQPECNNENYQGKKLKTSVIHLLCFALGFHLFSLPFFLIFKFNLK